MKTLYLLRHAKAMRPAVPMRDFDRALSERGWQDASVMARQLRAHSGTPDLIISSPARRARETAEVLATGLGYDQAAIRCESQVYLADSQRLLQVLRQIEDFVASVLVVGHNPAFTDLANLLSDEGRVDHIPTCGVVTLQIPVDTWAQLMPHQARFLNFDYP